MDENLPVSAAEFEEITGRPLGCFHLLALGVEHYKHHERAKNSVKDTEEICRILKENYGFTIHNLPSTTTATELKREIRKFTHKSKDKKRQLTKNDFLVIWISGHGKYDPDGTGKGFFIPYHGTKDIDDEKRIRFSDITDFFHNIKAHQILLIVDTCYSGAVFKSIDAEEYIPYQFELSLLQSRGRQALTSGRTEKVRSDGPNGHSPFADALITALEANRDFAFAVNDIYSSVRKYFKKNSQFKHLPLLRPLQNSGENGGEFVFFKQWGIHTNITADNPTELKSNNKVVEGEAVYIDDIADKESEPLPNKFDNECYLDGKPAMRAETEELKFLRMVETLFPDYSSISDIHRFFKFKEFSYELQELFSKFSDYVQMRKIYLLHVNRSEPYENIGPVYHEAESLKVVYEHYFRDNRELIKRMYLSKLDWICDNEWEGDSDNFIRSANLFYYIQGEEFIAAEKPKLLRHFPGSFPHY